jgi:hypothetical protein
MSSGSTDTRSHSWSLIGTYNVKVKAKDQNGALSGFSDALTVTITSGENQPPNKPSVPTGTVNGKAGKTYTYSSTTTDPDGDQIQYLFDWGDGQTSPWTTPVNSGQPGSASHSWSQGNYQIKVKARDVPNFVESPWSDPLSISMPKSKQSTNLLFLQFIEKLIHHFPLLANIFNHR